MLFSVSNVSLFYYSKLFHLTTYKRTLKITRGLDKNLNLVLYIKSNQMSQKIHVEASALIGVCLGQLKQRDVPNHMHMLKC